MPELPAGAADDAAPPIEINRRPRFDLNEKVRARQLVRNDGTYPGQRIGTALVEPGEIGYITSIGEFLQRYYIYSVDFIALGRIVGMREHEMERVDVEMKVTVGRRGETITVYVAKKDLEEPVVAKQNEQLWGGWIELANGWRLELPDLPGDTRLPITVEARRLESAD